MSDLYDDERPLPTPTEGVRILGAEEVRAELGARESSPPPDDEPQILFGDTADGDDIQILSGPADDMQVLTPPARGADEPAPATTDDDARSGEVPALPHWSEPATGAVPAIFADDADESGDQLDAWATVTGAQPRFRAEGSDWAASDFGEDLSGEHVKLGALSNEGPVDEDEAFARDLAAKRRGPRRAAGTATARRATGRGPGSSPAETEFPPREAPSGRDLPTAIITGAAVAVVAIVCLSQGEGWTNALAAVIIGVATLELAGSLQKSAFRPATLVALVAATLMPLAAREYGTAAYPVFIALVVLVSMLWFMWEITPGRPLVGVASTVLTFAYVGGLGGFAGLLLASSNGVRLVLGVALCVIAYDVFGFFVGSQFGHTAIAPKISPNKTVEGAVAGMLASAVVGAAIVGQIEPWNIGRGLALGVLVALGAFVGDLCESMLKRDLGLKDLGSLLPGHGGVLDRFDSLLFCLPIAYYLALQFKIY